MDKMRSSEFRKVYPRLTEPIDVTVNGHLIGTWYPASPGQKFVDQQGWTAETVHEKVNAMLAERGLPTHEPHFTERERSFNSRPFTPVPKR